MRELQFQLTQLPDFGSPTVRVQVCLDGVCVGDYLTTNGEVGRLGGDPASHRSSGVSLSI